MSYSTVDSEEPEAERGHRNYEVYQRERVGETTNLVDPRDLIADGYLQDPFTLPAVLRENYPCYRDWVSNRFWVTRYDDVTSIFVDDANFESRPIGAVYGAEVGGVDLGSNQVIEAARVELVDAAVEASAARILDTVSGDLDLVVDYIDQLAADLVSTVYGFGAEGPELFALVAAAKAGTGWNERDRVAGIEAMHELQLRLQTLLAARKTAPTPDLLSALAASGASSADAAMTLVESDLATLPASMANMWCLLLGAPEQLERVKAAPRLMKFAYLEALRHSPSAVTADRFTRHEVERFGRLLPQGALVHLSAAAANRDPRYFERPDQFDLARKDLCQREPRGQFRADGLPAGVVFGHGKPSSQAASPKDGPRSRYALTRDVAVAASRALLEKFPKIRLADDADPKMSLDRQGGTYRCRSLPTQTT